MVTNSRYKVQFLVSAEIESMAEVRFCSTEKNPVSVEHYLLYT